MNCQEGYEIPLRAETLLLNKSRRLEKCLEIRPTEWSLEKNIVVKQKGIQFYCALAHAVICNCRIWMQIIIILMFPRMQICVFTQQNHWNQRFLNSGVSFLLFLSIVGKFRRNADPFSNFQIIFICK